MPAPEWMNQKAVLYLETENVIIEAETYVHFAEALDDLCKRKEISREEALRFFLTNLLQYMADDKDSQGGDSALLAASKALYEAAMLPAYEVICHFCGIRGLTNQELTGDEGVMCEGCVDLHAALRGKTDVFQHYQKKTGRTPQQILVFRTEGIPFVP